MEDGISEPLADLLANCDNGTAEGFLQATDPQLDSIIGRLCITIEEAVKTALAF